MMNRFLRVIFLIFLTLHLSSCGASFKKRHFKHDLQKLNQKNYQLLDGTYSVNPKSVYHSKSKNFFSDSIFRKMNTYNLFVNEPIKFSKLDTIEFINSNKKFALRFISSEQIEIIYLINDVIKSREIINGKIKRNGLFYLDNKYFESKGIPYLWGGIDVKKRRIGLSKSGNLIFNGAYCREGALLFLFAAGTSYNTVYEIEKIN